MKRREVAWAAAGAAAGLLIGGVGWLVTHGLTAPRDVAPVQIGDPFPPVTGRLLTGRTLALPDDLEGDLGLLIVAWEFEASREVAEWGRLLFDRYGVLPGVHVLEVAMVSGVGPVMRRVIDRAMTQGTPAPEREHALTVYGDLRRLRLALDTVATARPSAAVLLLDRHGRLAWRADGAPTGAALEALGEAMAAHGVVQA